VRSSHLRPESDDIVHVVLPSNGLPVGKNLLSLCILLGPLRVGGERTLVDMGGNVASDTRIDVFKPRAPYIAVLFDDGEIDPR
nr:hypothetical protein [Tanacetum cinerariifolium]